MDPECCPKWRYLPRGWTRSKGMNQPKITVLQSSRTQRRPRVWPAIFTIFFLLLNGCGTDRVYDAATRCAELISRGLDCDGAATSNSTQNAPKSALTPSPTPTNRDLDPTGNISIQPSRVYLDATESMKGYTTSGGATFTRLIESLSYAMPGSRLYKYGVFNNNRTRSTSQSTQLSEFAREIRFSQDLRHPEFYNLPFNEDDVLFEYLADEERPVLSVLITDGVYSARESELASTEINAIHKWLVAGHCFGILIFTSPFEGSLYSENRRTWLRGVKAAGRPFYAYVFSPDERAFRDLEEKLATEFTDMRVLLFSQETFSCSLLPVLKQGLESKKSPPLSPFYLQMYNSSIFDNEGSAELTFDLQCVPPENYPVAELKFDVSLNCYSWQQDSFKPSPTPSRFVYSYAAATPALPSPSADPKSESGRPSSVAPPAKGSLKVRLPRDTESPYSLYRVSLGLTPQTLRPEIRALSTEDDSEVTQAEQTYRFFEFISALTTVHLHTPSAIHWPAPVLVVTTNK